MAGTFMGVEIGRRGIQTHQKALNVTGHNLTNASTPGYTRQEAVFETSLPFNNPSFDSSATNGQYGTGVDTSMISRIRDEYLDPQARNSNKDRYYWEEQVSIMNRVEASFAEPSSSGIQDQMVEFFKGWQNLNNNPQDPAVKAAVTEIGVQFASLSSYTYTQLTHVEESIIKPGIIPEIESGQLKDSVDKINELLYQIQNLTQDIMKVYKVGQQPNDLLDKRDYLLDELSKYAPLKVINKTVGGKPTGETVLNFYDLTITSVPRQNTQFKLQLVDNKLELQETGTSWKLNLTDNYTDTGKGGSLLGLEKARQNIIELKSDLNFLADSLKTKIAQINLAPPAAEVIDFFTGTLAGGDYRVNPMIASDPGIIEGTKSGQIADIRQQYIDPDNNVKYTLEEGYALLVTNVGNMVKSNEDMAANQQAIQEQMFNLREAVAGVSVDEELANMVQFQYGYQASARVISMMDEILDEVVNRLKQI
ncbi:MAG: flagellar hook-associated protein FlgK [Peptococcaceae bacterium]|nr:flagellar hook-associated protein FlgK [Peptococcaceae bacterium]